MNLFHRFQRDPFYESRGWRKARYMVLKTHGRTCSCCRRTPEQHKVALHVDHVVPRSKDRDKELVLSNLQVLCEDCNLGKGNTDRIKWYGGPSRLVGLSMPLRAAQGPQAMPERGGQLLLFDH
jgi:hypothetical protein